MKVVFISWAEYCSRSDNTAREFGGSSHMVYLGWLGSNIYTVWLKYLGQSCKTLYILFVERPEAAFVMSPPVIAVLPVAFYALFANIPYVIDAHTAAFLHPRWKRWQWLQRFLSRHAVTTIVTNDYLARYVQSGGAKATIITDIPVVYDFLEEFEVDRKFSIAIVCSFNYDEPIEEIFKAAEQLPDFQFYMTGNPKDLHAELAKIVPDNIVLTGFLSNSTYGSLIKKASAVMTLTTRDHTMLRGAYEAVYQETPVIISDWSLLRNSFDEGAIHVDNSVDEIVRALIEMKNNYPFYKNGVKSLRKKKYNEWNEKKEKIKACLIKD